MISKAIKMQLRAAFIYTTFPSREEQDVAAILGRHVHGSETMTLLPQFNKVTITPIDEERDRIVLDYEDVKVEGILTWKVSDFPKGWKLINVF